MLIDKRCVSQLSVCSSAFDVFVLHFPLRLIICCGICFCDPTRPSCEMTYDSLSLKLGHCASTDNYYYYFINNINIVIIIGLCCVPWWWCDVLQQSHCIPTFLECILCWIKLFHGIFLHLFPDHWRQNSVMGHLLRSRHEEVSGAQVLKACGTRPQGEWVWGRVSPSQKICRTSSDLITNSTTVSWTY